MFVYLLIASELAVLYTVFWYLYVREPRANRRISANLWGTYEDAVAAQADALLPFLRPRDQFYAQAIQELEREYVLDQVTNHYVPVLGSGSLFKRAAASVDRTLSQLNVKP